VQQQMGNQPNNGGQMMQFNIWMQKHSHKFDLHPRSKDLYSSFLNKALFTWKRVLLKKKRRMIWF
jgi:hypothetical protein